nr:reverse transcriptase zinc-binding domain-containing protein [Tanacetum cinerariifolium]
MGGVKKMCWLEKASSDWNDIIETMRNDLCNKTIRSIVRRLGVAASLYFIWHERNKRLFADEKREWKERALHLDFGNLSAGAPYFNAVDDAKSLCLRPGIVQ